MEKKGRQAVISYNIKYGMVGEFLFQVGVGAGAKTALSLKENLQSEGKERE